MSKTCSKFFDLYASIYGNLPIHLILVASTTTTTATTTTTTTATTTTTTTTHLCYVDVTSVSCSVPLAIFVSRLNTPEQNIHCLLSRDLKKVLEEGEIPPPPHDMTSRYRSSHFPQHTWARAFNPFELSTTWLCVDFYLSRNDDVTQV